MSLTPQKARARLGSSVDVIMDPSPYQIADSMILSKVRPTMSSILLISCFRKKIAIQIWT